MKKFIGALAVGTLVLAGCGDDDGGADLSGAQQQAVDQLMDSAGEAGFSVELGCVEGLAADLSEEDAEAIVAAGPDGDADLSAEGEALSDQLLSCVDEDDLIDTFIEQIEASGQEVDDECVRDALDGMDIASMIASGGDEPPAELIEAVLGCVEL